MEKRHAQPPAYYLNTGSWVPAFVEGRRRLETLGRDVQFTFVRLAQSGGEVEADVWRWNDDAGRADPLIVLLARPET